VSRLHRFAQELPRAYQPLLSAVERRAYQAAHRILTEAWRSELPSPGGRRSAELDGIAKIIQECFEVIP